MTHDPDPHRDARPVSAPPYAAPPRDSGITRFLGGSPIGVALRLILLSVLVGVLLATFGLDPRDIIYSIRRLFAWIADLGFDAFDSLWRYFLLGAVIVVPIWLIMRLLNAPRGR